MKKIIKLISTILIISITMNLIVMFTHRTNAIQHTSSEIDQLNDNKYPGIKQQIKALQSKYPNWQFKIFYTGLDWNTVIANEYIGHGDSPRNLIANSTNYQGEWICPICKETAYDNGNWKCASEKCIKYMMDPRNSINEADVFQFEEMSYTGYDMSVVQNMTNGTYLKGHEQYIVNASINNNMNPYFIIAKLIHEQGTSGTMLVAGNGDMSGNYKGYYNAFNIGASGNGPEKIITNGLLYARKKGWTSLDASILGGIQELSSVYVQRGQNTLYLQKFDVAESAGLYWNQYMQNITAAQTEGEDVRNVYIKMNKFATAHTFIIPVYENMPQTVCARPNTTGSSSVQTDLVKVNVDTNLLIRKSPNDKSSYKDLLYKNEIVTRLEKATSKVGGTYWDKIRKSNGVEGYVARETYDGETPYKMYLVPLSSGGSSSSSQITGTNTAKVKIDNTNNIITVSPDAIANDILIAFGGPTKITKPDGNFLDYGENHPMGTGFIVLDRYTVVKKGDCNGDGKVDTADLLAIQKQLLKIKNIESGARTKAADINNDSKIDTADLLAIQKKLLNICDIKI